MYKPRIPRLSRNTTPAEDECTIKITKHMREISHHEREFTDLTNCQFVPRELEIIAQFDKTLKAVFLKYIGS